MTVSISSITMFSGVKGSSPLISPLASSKAVFPSLLLPAVLSSPCDSPGSLPSRIRYHRRGTGAGNQQHVAPRRTCDCLPLFAVMMGRP